jgi:hypothetical protein
VYRALSAYLDRLRRAGYVDYRADTDGYIGGPIAVLADTRHPPGVRMSVPDPARPPQASGA